MDKKLTVSASPHAHSSETTTGIMLDVIIALLPAAITSVIYFGYRALAVLATSIVSCVLFEFVSRKIMKRSNTLGDLSAVVTGIILAFNLPSTLPLWMVVIGAFIAIVIVKQMFGGIGQNFVNPAITARIILMSSFPLAMSTWTQPLVTRTGEAVTTASPLASLAGITKEADIASALSNANLPSIKDMFLGLRPGSMGEVCAVALLIGFVYLLIRKVISPIIPTVFVGTVAIFMLIVGKGNLEFVAYELLSGGLLLGAIFMATDYTTSPINKKGKIIFAIGCGLITSVIRVYGILPEGVSFSIILMNIFVPHIENLTTPKPFGSEKKKKEGKAA